MSHRATERSLADRLSESGTTFPGDALRVVEPGKEAVDGEDDCASGDGSGDGSPTDLVDPRDDSDACIVQLSLDGEEVFQALDLRVVANEPAACRPDGPANARAGIRSMALYEGWEFVDAGVDECPASLGDGEVIGHGRP